MSLLLRFLVLFRRLPRALLALLFLPPELLEPWLESDRADLDESWELSLELPGLELGGDLLDFFRLETWRPLLGDSLSSSRTVLDLDLVSEQILMAP